MNSLHQRLAAGLAVVVTCLVVIGGWAACQAVHRVLITQFDEVLLAKLRTLTSLPDDARHGISLQFTERPLPEYVRTQRPEYFQVWMSDGTILARSPSLGVDSLLPPPSFSTNARYSKVRLPGNRPGRAVTAGFDLGQDGSGRTDFGVVVVLARDTEDLQQAMRRLILGILLGGGVLLALAAWMVTIVSRVSLRPVDQLARAVEDIDVRSLTRRVSAAIGPQELRPVVDQINRLLNRLQEAFERERRFSANAAHELLTPVAELRAVAENALRWKDDPEATGQLAQDVLETSLQLDRLVHTLLVIARHAPDEVRLELTSMDIATLLEDLREEHSAHMAARGLTVEWHLPPTLRLQTDAAACHSIIQNLIKNASEHTPRGGRVRCELNVLADTFRFTIENTNPGLSSSDLPRLAEPFWRKDPARTDRSHAGLGLALVAVLASALGWTFRTELMGKDRFVATLLGPVGIHVNTLPAPEQTPAAISTP